MEEDLEEDFEVDLEGDLEGDSKWDFKRDFREDFKQDLEGDLLSSSGQVQVRSSLVQFWLVYSSNLNLLRVTATL